MKDPVDHIVRPLLPWRSPAAAITECGFDVAKVKTITRPEYDARLKELGYQRTAMLTCMTCADTSKRWTTWDDDPRRAIGREVHWESTEWGRSREHGTRLRDELIAIAALIEAHRQEFESILNSNEQKRKWLEMKTEHQRKPKAKPEKPIGIL